MSTAIDINNSDDKIVKKVTSEEELSDVGFEKADIIKPHHNDLPDQVPFTVWCILIISSLGVFMASVSTTALVIAFPVILIGKPFITMYDYIRLNLYLFSIYVRSGYDYINNDVGIISITTITRCCGTYSRQAW